MDIVLPDGVEEEVNMVDDGLHFDLVSFSGFYIIFLFVDFC